MPRHKRWSLRWIWSKVDNNAFTGEFLMVFGASLLGAVFGATLSKDSVNINVQRAFFVISIFFIIFGYFTKKKG